MSDTDYCNREWEIKTRQELHRILSQMEEWDRNELIHDIASNIASNVNNNGLEGQIDWLVEIGITPEELE